MTRSAQSATIARPFGAARRDWRKAQQSLDLRFAHECYHYLGVRLPDACFVQLHMSYSPVRRGLPRAKVPPLL